MSGDDGTGVTRLPAESRPRGFGRKYQRGEVWWIEYWNHGHQFRESTKSRDERDADRLLKARWKQIGRGRFVGPSEDRVRLEDLLDVLTRDYELNQRRSRATLPYRIAALKAAFAGQRAVDITEDRIERYKVARLAEGKAAGTVNRELAALRRAFRLAVKHKRISRAPDIEMLAEAPPREGFVEPNHFEALVGHLPDDLHDLARWAYLVGWRRGGVLQLRWADVDRDNRRVYLRAVASKNGKPYVVVLTDELAAIVERRWQARTVTRSDGTTGLAEYVFHRRAAPIRDFRSAWKSACIAAGFCRPKTDDAGRAVLGRNGKPVMKPTVLFHDFRRSAARNLERAGVRQSVAMKVTGHLTDSMWRRYRIVDEDDIERALAAAQSYVRTQATVKLETNVIALSEARGGRA